MLVSSVRTRVSKSPVQPKLDQASRMLRTTPSQTIVLRKAQRWMADTEFSGQGKVRLRQLTVSGAAQTRRVPGARQLPRAPSSNSQKRNVPSLVGAAGSLSWLWLSARLAADSLLGPWSASQAQADTAGLRKQAWALQASADLRPVPCLSTSKHCTLSFSGCPSRSPAGRLQHRRRSSRRTLSRPSQSPQCPLSVGKSMFWGQRHVNAGNANGAGLQAQVCRASRVDKLQNQVASGNDKSKASTCMAVALLPAIAKGANLTMEAATIVQLARMQKVHVCVATAAFSR